MLSLIWLWLYSIVCYLFLEINKIRYLNTFKMTFPILGQTFGVNKNVIKIVLISTPCLWLKDPSVWPLRSKEQKDLLFMHKPWQTIESPFLTLGAHSCIIEKIKKVNCNTSGGIWSQERGVGIKTLDRWYREVRKVYVTN